MRPFFNVYLIYFQNPTIFSCQYTNLNQLLWIREAICQINFSYFDTNILLSIKLFVNIFWWFYKKHFNKWFNWHFYQNKGTRKIDFYGFKWGKMCINKRRNAILTNKQAGCRTIDNITSRMDIIACIVKYIQEVV